MSSPIALQLYTLRREADRDFRRVVERVAAIGYLGVEIGDFHGMSPKSFRCLLDEYGLQIASAHIVAETNELHRVLEEQRTIANDVVVMSFDSEEFASYDAIERTAVRLNEAAEIVREFGMSLGYHNHWWEFLGSRDVPNPMAHLLDRIDSDIFLELDIYWLQTSGVEPMTVMSRLVDRVRLLHVKDGPCTFADPMTAVGSGRVNIPELLAVVPRVDWHIVELDEYAGDMFEAVETSYQYLVGNQLSRGQNGGSR